MRISDWSSDVCSSDLSVGENECEPIGRFRRRVQSPGTPRRPIGECPMKTRRRGGLIRPAPIIQFRGTMISSGWTTLSFLRASRSEEHTSELQSLMRISYAVFCLKKKHTQKYT